MLFFRYEYYREDRADGADHLMPCNRRPSDLPLDLRVGFYHTIPGGKLHVSAVNEVKAEADTRPVGVSEWFRVWGLGFRV